jgi:hypothetical protein
VARRPRDLHRGYRPIRPDPKPDVRGSLYALPAGRVGIDLGTLDLTANHFADIHGVSAGAGTPSAVDDTSASSVASTCTGPDTAKPIATRALPAPISGTSP